MLEGEDGVVLGKKIKETRLKLGLTQESLGRRAKLHYSYIGQVERGNKVPSIKTLKRIALALNISMESLLYQEVGTKSADEDVLVREFVNAVRDCPPGEVKLLLNIVRQIRGYLEETRKKDGEMRETGVRHGNLE
ncbi:MAG: helix-turn-helix domain-containing protein [Firmicutes bacterium]|nr:helix-turn-helix domain-containing protein [Bacillota bacterium]